MGQKIVILCMLADLISCPQIRTIALIHLIECLMRPEKGNRKDCKHVIHCYLNIKHTQRGHRKQMSEDWKESVMFNTTFQRLPDQARMILKKKMVLWNKRNKSWSHLAQQELPKGVESQNVEIIKESSNHTRGKKHCRSEKKKAWPKKRKYCYH